MPESRWKPQTEKQYEEIKIFSNAVKAVKGQGKSAPSADRDKAGSNKTTVKKDEKKSSKADASRKRGGGREGKAYMGGGLN